jgi:hypothetical protein
MATSTGPLPQVAPDSYGQPGHPGGGYLSCVGATIVTLQISNAGVVLQFGQGSPPVFDGQPEVPRLPVVDRLPVRCDAIRWRAQTPAAQLPAGQAQATVQIDTLP